jgi:hypothetical protein
MRDFVTKSQSGIVTAGDDVEAAAEALVKFYQSKRAGPALLRPDRAFIEQFERRELTRKLAGALDELVQTGCAAASV